MYYRCSDERTAADQQGITPRLPSVSLLFCIPSQRSANSRQLLAALSWLVTYHISVAAPEHQADPMLYCDICPGSTTLHLTKCFHLDTSSESFWFTFLVYCDVYFEMCVDENITIHDRGFQNFLSQLPGPWAWTHHARLKLYDQSAPRALVDSRARYTPAKPVRSAARGLLA